jgi:hypothetical protein
MPTDPETGLALAAAVQRLANWTGAAMFAGLLGGGLLRRRVRVSGNGQPGASAPLPYCLLCVGSFGVARSLIANRDSGQVGALLDIKCQSFRSFRLVGRRDRCSLHRPVLGWLGACPVLIGHGSQPFR